MTTNHDEFRAQMAERLNNYGFRPKLPPETHRSSGLDNQSAIIVGFKLDSYSRNMLSTHAVRNYPNSGMYGYLGTALHSTIGVRQATKGSDAILDPDELLKLHQDEINKLARAINMTASTRYPVPCGPLQTLTNGDSVIGVVEATDELLNAKP